MSDHLSLHQIDELTADLVGAERAGALRAHAAGCPRCTTQLRDAEAARDAFLIGHPPAARAAALLGELPATRPWRWRIPALISGVAAAALAAILVLRPRAASEDSVRFKGEGAACQLLRHAETIAVLAAGDALVPAAPGDAIRCQLATGPARHVAIWGWDAHEPPAVLHELDTLADQPVVLDRDFAIAPPAGGPGELRLYVIESPTALPAASIAGALATARHGPALPTAIALAGARVWSVGVTVR